MGTTVFLGRCERLRLGAAGIQPGNPMGSTGPTLTGAGDPQKLNFWDMIIHPERVTWAQRRRFSELFMKNTSIDWSLQEGISTL